MRTSAMILAGCLALTACGADGSDREPTATPAPPTSAPADDPTLTAKPPGGSRSVTGIVASGVEAGCIVLTVAGGRSFVLTGSVAGLSDGDRVTVTGRVDPEAASTCQQGPVLVVAEVAPR